jgi:hypothetical protein
LFKSILDEDVRKRNHQRQSKSKPDKHFQRGMVRNIRLNILTGISLHVPPLAIEHRRLIPKPALLARANQSRIRQNNHIQIHQTLHSYQLRHLRGFEPAFSEPLNADI